MSFNSGNYSQEQQNRWNYEKALYKSEENRRIRERKEKANLFINNHAEQNLPKRRKVQ